MPGEIETAVAECIKARKAAAAPLEFTAEALTFANERTEKQFTANLAAVGGWEKARPALLRAATLFGATAKAIAQFHRATEIDADAADTARRMVESECRLGLARLTKRHPTAVGTADGLICGGG